MFNKKINRAVLDVNEIKAEIKAEIKDEIKDEIKELCQGLVAELFGDMRDQYEILYYWNKETIKTLGGELKDRMVAAARSEFDELYKTRAKSFIAGEKFIDSVVERIHKKQLTTK